jgi:hypothetical protein
MQPPYNLSFILYESSTQLAYVVVGKLCAWSTQYNSSCRKDAYDSFNQILCDVRKSALI